uniref:Glycosyltransferase 2-like domain-containing protein n=1 Tax=Papio anubis TaxID=9555 RepID=A0A096N9T6_PAPAN
MAVARKIRTLLTVNILVFVGIVLFSVYCRLQGRSQELVRIVSGDRRVRSRHAKVGALGDREAILQRLDHLEEVVYNQLNGLAKPIGLVEGPGGLGQGGLAATLRDDGQEAEGKYEEYGYNAQLSDRISLDRSIPDYRPRKCRQMSYAQDLPQVSVVFIFVNEALSVILRSVHSVVNHTPSQLLKEVILVDDNSDNVELKFNLDQYVNKRYPGLVKIVRNSRREGLIRARLQGWKAATAPVVGFFDAHVEFNTGWAEPALSRIREDRRRIVLPAIDNIKYSTFEVQQYANAAHGYNWGLWCMYIIPPQDWLDRGDESAPIRTPAMIGCSFVVDREYFGDIGLLDPGMEVYGGENVELGMRVSVVTVSGDRVRLSEAVASEDRVRANAAAVSGDGVRVSAAAASGDGVRAKSAAAASGDGVRVSAAAVSRDGVRVSKAAASGDGVRAKRASAAVASGDGVKASATTV